MNSIWYINSALILVGIIALAFSFFLASRIIRELRAGKLKDRWIILRVLTCVFIAGYILYWVILPHDVDSDSLIVSGVFFLGAVFVLVVCWLMLQTTRDIKRVTTLELQNITDPLLGIYNRRYLDQRLNEEVARAQRYKLPLSLLLFDIDHFKQINDQFGHLIGDRVLSSMGRILQEQVRKSDLAARYGGEEIVIVLPNTAEEEAFTMAERLRLLLGQTAYAEQELNNGGVHCTVSIGVASLIDETGGADLLHKSDVAMYQAKRTGRNRVVAYKKDYEDNLVK